MFKLQQDGSAWGTRWMRRTVAAMLMACGGAAGAANVAVTLCAQTGAAPAPISAAVYGYSLDTGSGCGAVTRPGGPTIIVDKGDSVTITLKNNLAAASGLTILGQAMPFDATGAPAGGTKTYTFTASQPGTYLYEAAPVPGTEYQVAMGLYGAIVVRSSTANQAYDSAATAYDTEAVLVLSEFDPAVSATSGGPANFDMRTYAPKFFLINGQPYPNTETFPATGSYAANSKVVLRYLNAGAKHHSMGVLGLRQVFVARDGNLLPQANHNVVAESIAPGQTADAIVTIPAAVTTESRFAVYDASLALYNDGSSSSFGGMLAFIKAGTGSSTAGPTVTALTVAGPPTPSMSATFQAATGRTVQAAEYWLDGGAHVALAATFGGNTASVTNVPLTLTAASGTLFTRAQDNTNVWGAVRSIAYVNDTTGPAISGLTLTPASAAAGTTVALAATATDAASNVVAAQYRLNAGTPQTATLGGAAALSRSVTASITGLTAGSYAVDVRAQDALGNWGAWSTAATLTITASAPVTSGVTVQKTPNNGTVPLSATQAVVRVQATVASSGGSVAAAEGFIGTVGANGSGFVFVPADGAWGGASEAVYADIPLTTVAGLPAGPNTISVHGKDALGQWGAVATATLVIDKTAPTINAAAVTPNTVLAGTASTTLSITATDNLGVAAAQYWIDGSTTPPANPLTTGTTGGSIGTAALAGGTHSVYVRVQDQATNWSAVSTVTPLYVVQGVADARTITSTTSATPQTSDASGGNSVLSNDQPTGVAARTVRINTAPVRTSNGTGNGTGTIAISCPNTLGTAATPAVGGSTICTNGNYRVTLTPTGTTNAARQSSKRGTYQFSYIETLNGVSTAPITVTITVN